MTQGGCGIDEAVFPRSVESRELHRNVAAKYGKTRSTRRVEEAQCNGKIFNILLPCNIQRVLVTSLISAGACNKIRDAVRSRNTQGSRVAGVRDVIAKRNDRLRMGGRREAGRRGVLALVTWVYFDIYDLPDLCSVRHARLRDLRVILDSVCERGMQNE